MAIVSQSALCTLERNQRTGKPDKRIVIFTTVPTESTEPLWIHWDTPVVVVAVVVMVVVVMMVVVMAVVVMMVVVMVVVVMMVVVMVVVVMTVVVMMVVVVVVVVGRGRKEGGVNLLDAKTTPPRPD